MSEDRMVGVGGCINCPLYNEARAVEGSCYSFVPKSDDVLGSGGVRLVGQTQGPLYVPRPECDFAEALLSHVNTGEFTGVSCSFSESVGAS